jgi:Zn-dependent peptidase ImmA (M78 family)
MPGLLGVTNGRDRIVMHPHQTQVQRRCTLAHELAHIELGHTDGCRHRDEAAARELAARRLIDLDRLLAAWKWATSEAEMADELWVDTDTLRTRIETLTDDEKAQVVAMILDQDNPA